MSEIYLKTDIKKSIKKNFKQFMDTHNFLLYKSEFLIRITNDILQGVYFQASTHQKKILVTTFIQPLFVPEDTIVLSEGFRMDRITTGKEEWISLDEEGCEKIKEYLHRIALPFFQSYDSPLKILENEDDEKYQFLWKSNSWSSLYCKAFCSVAVGRFDKFELFTKQLKGLLGGKNIAWMDYRLKILRDVEIAIKEGVQSEYLNRNSHQMKEKLKLK